MKKISKKYNLTQSDYQRRGRDVLVFLSPTLIAILTGIQSGDMTRSDSGNLFATMIIGATIDLLRRFLQDYGQTPGKDDTK